MSEAAGLPVWDRLEGIPDPAENLTPTGLQATLDVLCAAYATGRMHHAWLLTGPRGIGKATAAARFAAHLLRHGEPAAAPKTWSPAPAGDAAEAGVASGAHPNIVFLRRPWDEERKRFRGEITVEEVRRAIAFLGSTAAGGRWRVVIVDPADDLNANAANALLKSLEEPPARTVFLVLANAPRRLLATLRSRCLPLAVPALTADAALAALERLGLGADHPSDDLRHAAGHCGGSVRRAILILREDGVEMQRRLARLIEGRARPDWSEIHALAGTLLGAEAEDRYRLFLDFVHDAVSARVAAAALPLPALAGWVEVWEKTRRAAELADEYNLDRKQAILNLFQFLRTAA
jgi:DNA polymerase-3 subunit delta'